MAYGVVIIHYTPLRERRLGISNSLPRSLSPIWVTEKDSPKVKIVQSSNRSSLFGSSWTELSQIHLSNVVETVLPSYLARLMVCLIAKGHRASPWLRAKALEVLNKAALPDTPEVAEVRLMHVRAWEAVTRSQNEWVAVLEDDSLASSEAWKVLEELTENVPKAIDVINLSRHNLRRQCKSGTIAWQRGAVTLRLEKHYFTPNSYLIRRSLAESLLSCVKEQGLPSFTSIDFIYVAAFRHLNATVAFLCPPPFDQGSELGTYASGFKHMRT